MFTRVSKASAARYRKVSAATAKTHARVDAASHQGSAVPGDDVHFNVRAGQQARRALEERAGVADLDDGQLASRAQPHARERLAGIRRSPRHGAALGRHQNTSTHASRAVT